MGNKAFKGEGNTLGSGGGGQRAGVGAAQRQGRQAARSAAVAKAGTRASRQTDKPKRTKLAREKPKPRSASEVEAVRSAAAAAADARANAWSNRSAKGRKERERRRREDLGRMAAVRGGTAASSARASHAATKTVMRSSSAVRTAMAGSTPVGSGASAGGGGVGGGSRSGTTFGGNAGASVFSSSLLDHHAAVDQNEVERLMPLLTQSSIRQRNDAFADRSAETAPPPSLPENMEEIARICSVDNDASPDLALALVASHADRAAAGKAVKMLQTLLGNILQHPSEEKFRSVRLCNKAIQRRLCSVPGAIDMLAAAGFVLAGEAGDPRLVFAETAKLEKLEAALTAITMALSQTDS
eukprot:g3149.t1